jgi:CubicO group peptidase (beta-lactamase class C family)
MPRAAGITALQRIVGKKPDVRPPALGRRGGVRQRTAQGGKNERKREQPHPNSREWSRKCPAPVQERETPPSLDYRPASVRWLTPARPGMRMHRHMVQTAALRYVLRLALVCAVLLPIGARGGLAQGLPTATPESQGFSTERLERLHKRMHEFVSEGKHAGVVVLIARNGKIVDSRTYGLRDREQKLPMEEDTIFRIYSMSKVVTSVAALILHEEGRLKLHEPISTYLPAFDKAKVMRGGTIKAPVLVAAKTPITVKQLLTHTSGYIYGFGKEPIDKIYSEAKLLQAPTMAAFLERASKMPLAQQPGQSFRYGISTDLLGAVVEKVSGQTLDAFIESRITGPLGMKETSFTVPAGKRARVAKVYTSGKEGQLTPAGELVPGNIPYPDEEGRLFPSGGGGLFSTIGDYARFGQMLLNGGALDGVRILGRKTVELMEVNHLAGLTRETLESNDYDGFGLGGSVRVSLARSSRLGSVGQFGWSGAATTDFRIDPQEQLMTLVFTQHFPYNQHDLFWNALTLTYAALVDDPKSRDR